MSRAERNFRPASRSSVLRGESLSKRFGGLHVFEDISFELSAGQVQGVIGPNGAGKTTLINCISGMLAPSAGRVRLNDHDITGKSLHHVSALGVARSFQQTSTFKGATVEENLYRAQRFSRRGKTIDLSPLLEEFGLTRHFHAQSDSLPYGLQKMLGLVMVLSIGPDFLLLDEPAAGLERRERGQIDTFVHFASRRIGCGVLIVEHDMDMVKRICPHILVLDSGRFLASGPPDEVLQRQEVQDAYLGTSGG